ncbi:hypothetical protein HPP92_017064 [Vanilla planifolia]|uniref:Uncharacterized protein n=1 Tax=Vanilla planifolia TaxID=51239 RepID=A0A835QPX8_VANPL|nr:hypothetical protein HPP92_017064 [Vanilla planifolia]
MCANMGRECGGVVSLEKGATEGANDGPPRSPMNWNIANPRSCLDVGNACPSATARADPRRRLRTPHHPASIHQEAEHHCCCALFRLPFVAVVISFRETSE